MMITGKMNKNLREAIEFFASNLFTPQMKRHIEIRIRQKDLGTWHGFVIIEDYNVLNQPRSFIIELHKNDSETEKLKTLAHEMIHVKQYVRNELNDEMSMWKGRKVNSDAMNYDDQPWEIEANQLGDKLYELYTNKA
jgi:hypothetical protein